MKYVPHWVVDALMSKKFKCHHCKKAFATKDLTALGIRESYKDAGVESFFIELFCSSCKKTTFFEMQEMNIVELSEDILAEIDEDMEAMEQMEEYPEMDMMPGKKEIDRRKELLKDLQDGMTDEEMSKKYTPQKSEISQITCKDVRDAIKVLEPEDLKHESFLEMLGMSPEEIMGYREK